MMKKLMLGVAVSALMLSGAMAQTTPSPSPPSGSTPPAASPPPAAEKPAVAPDKPAADENKAAAAEDEKGKPKFVESQKPDQWLASKFKGTDVVGDDDKKIGDVSDVLFDKKGKIEAFVISVGGFLGMGAKDVALAPNSFEVMPGDNGGSDKLKLSMSQDQLKQTQGFKPYEPPRPATTTGAGGGGGGSPLGGRPTGGGMGR